MSFDDQLRQSFDTLTDRLRDHIARELAGVADAVAKEAQADRDLAAKEAADRARADAERAADVRVSEAEEAAIARVNEAEEAAIARVKETERAGAVRLAAAVAAAESNAEAHARDASNAEARARDASDARTRQAVADAVSAVCDEMRVADSAAGERLLDAIRAIDRARSLTEILDTLVSSAGREAPRAGILLVRGETLKGWRFIGFNADGPIETELALDAAGLIGDVVRAGVTASSATAGTLTGAPFELPEGRERVALPIPLSGQVVAVLYADQGADDDPAQHTARSWAATLDVMARHAARCLEALTAFKAARALTERPDTSAAIAPGAEGSAADVDRSADEEESARRYARLLVSEIKLYHEPAVAAGRRERDLGTRLSAEIARARVLYEQRVPAHVRQQTDHFHAELIRTLANGDAALLGQAT